MVYGHPIKVTFRHFLLLLVFISCEKVSVIGESSGGNGGSLVGNVGESRSDYGSNQNYHHGTTYNPLSQQHPTASTLQQEESLRKEMIKVQILQRLGLNEKPQVDLSKQISRDLVIETLRRTENFDQDDSSSFKLNPLNATLNHDEDTTNSYAKTSEIISFPDKGQY
jgi:hypothetical protein